MQLEFLALGATQSGTFILQRHAVCFYVLPKSFNQHQPFYDFYSSSSSPSSLGQPAATAVKNKMTAGSNCQIDSWTSTWLWAMLTMSLPKAHLGPKQRPVRRLRVQKLHTLWVICRRRYLSKLPRPSSQVVMTRMAVISPTGQQQTFQHGVSCLHVHLYQAHPAKTGVI